MNYKVVIDAGHGGNDPGTSKNGIIEKEYTLKISNYIHDRLDQLGIPNKLVRDSDTTLSPSQRVSKIKSLYGTGKDVLVISNHLNSGGGDGAEVIYSLRNSDKFSSIIKKNMEAAGQNVRKYYQRRLPSNPAKDYYFILRDTANNESILMEYAFVDSTKDDVNQIKNNWKQLAEAVVKSIAEYTGYKYSAPSNNESTNSNENTYIVKKGDSLWSIANKYGITVDNLKSANNLSSNLLQIGQKLTIPKSNADKQIYTVVKGDTLWDIANKYNTTVDKLKVTNNLSSNLLQIGQKLIIPNNISNVDYVTYVVKKGDTLYDISRRYNVSVTDIVNANNLKSSLLSINQELKIPVKK